MNVRTKGPLTIDGIALGQTRSEVESTLGRSTTNANPAWARFYPQQPRPFWDSPLPLLVSFRSSWPERDVKGWRVQSLCGSILRQGDIMLLQVGDLAGTAVEILGSPDETFRSEPGYQCMTFGGCLVTFDEHSQKVVEISLRFPTRIVKLSSHAMSTASLDGAMAC